MEPDITAGGGVVYRESGNGRARYLIVHRPLYRDWTLAKGKPNRGESLADAAIREVREETGMSGKVILELGAIRYFTAAGNKKFVHYWLMEGSNGKFRPNKEVDVAEWLSYGKAVERLTYSRDRAVLEWAHQVRPDPNVGRIYLVRHGNAGDRRSWKGKDEKRPVSKRGEAQARSLVTLLTRIPVARIISSPYTRCVETVQPLASAIDLKVEIDDRLAEGNPVASTRRLIGDLAGTSAVVCSHGDIIGDLLGDAAERGVEIASDAAWKKGSTWALDTRKRTVKRARYFPPMTNRFD